MFAARIAHEMCQPVKANFNFLAISKVSIGFSFDHMLSSLDDDADDDGEGVVFGDIFVKAISKKYESKTKSKKIMQNLINKSCVAYWPCFPFAIEWQFWAHF